MEEKIYDRQVTKESLSMRVVDHKQIGRHYTASDLAELFAYSPKPPTNPPFERPTVSACGLWFAYHILISLSTCTYVRTFFVQEDNALCAILDKLEPQNINGYHKHDSLLQHVFGEELTEEEKKAAWENYKQQTTIETQR